MGNVEPAASAKAPFQMRMSMFASVKLTIPLLVLIAATVLVGAWCPQEASVGRDKVFEQFGPQVGAEMIKYGIADIFHSPWFLGLIGLLTVNMVACSVQRVFPKVRSLKQPMPFLGSPEISKLPASECKEIAASLQSVVNALQTNLKKGAYTVHLQGNRLTAHWGKYGRLAPTVTHIGLLMLLAGVTVTSWTGFAGFEPVLLGDELTFEKSEHSRQWLGKLPTWSVRVDATRKEEYETGDAKQWYSTLTVLDAHGNKLKTQEISVNNPLSYDGVDIYQSSWGLAEVELAFNGNKVRLPLRQMGKVNAAMLPLDPQTILIFSIHGADQPIRVFAKTPAFQQPRIITLLAKGQPQKLGGVSLEYVQLIPQSGLQYKSDPGLPITYVSFGFIMLGCLLAAVPHKQLWACAEGTADGTTILTVGGVSKKAKRAFEKQISKMTNNLAQQLGTPTEPPTLSAAGEASAQETEEEQPCPISS